LKIFDRKPEIGKKNLLSRWSALSTACLRALDCSGRDY
jgi:hypothetical protein